MSTPLVPPIYNQATGSKSYSSILYYVYCMSVLQYLYGASVPAKTSQSINFIHNSTVLPFDLDQVKNVWRQSIFMFALSLTGM